MFGYYENHKLVAIEGLSDVKWRVRYVRGTAGQIIIELETVFDGKK